MKRTAKSLSRRHWCAGRDLCRNWSSSTNNWSAGGVPDTHWWQAVRVRQLQAEMADGGPTSTQKTGRVRRRQGCLQAEQWTNLKNQITQLNNEHECARTAQCCQSQPDNGNQQTMNFCGECNPLSLRLGPHVRFSDRTEIQTTRTRN